MKAVQGRVTGRVQGVGFRYFTQDQAVQQGVSGYVKNLIDGSVEFHLQGDESAVNRVLSKLQNGPRFSKVESCESCEVAPNSAYTDFDILY